MELNFIENTETNFEDWVNLEKWICNTVQKEGKSIEALSFVFMSDDDLLEYNKNFLNHHYYTDVITFDDSNFPIISGDILISIDRVRDNSNLLKTKYLNEFLRVVIHGVLHLLGYKDKLEEEIKVMRSKEQLYLNQYQF